MQPVDNCGCCLIDQWNVGSNIHICVASMAVLSRLTSFRVVILVSIAHFLNNMKTAHDQPNYPFLTFCTAFL